MERLPRASRGRVLSVVKASAVNAPTDSAPPPARLRRWPRRILLGLLGLAVLIALAPFYLGPVLRRLVVDRIEERLDARASVQAVSFSWPARLRVRGLELADPEGAPLFSLDELAAELELGPLLSGKVHADVALAYPKVHLARARDGRWNWEHALAKVSAAAEPEAPSEDGPENLTEVRGTLRLEDGHVQIHGPHGDTTLADLRLEARLDGLERPAPFQLALEVRGPEGAAGAVRLEGSFTAASSGRIEVLGFAGEGKLQLAGLDLAAFGPALALSVPGIEVRDLGGMLDGRVELTLGAGLALTGTTELELRDLALRGPRPGAEPTRIARVSLRGRATQQGEGAGSQRLELAADSFLALTYEGRSSLPARGPGEVAGTFTLSGDLGRAADVARGWVPLQPGVVVQGRIEQVLELATVLADRQPLSATARAQGGIEGLAARDAAGRALDLSELQGIALELEAAADFAKGTLSVPKLALRAGPLSCEGNLQGTGVRLEAPAPVLSSGALRLSADLEKLRGTLAQVVELDALSFGGRLDASASLGRRGEALELTANVEGSALALSGARLADLRADLRAQRSSQGLSGTGSVQLGALELRLGPGEPLRLSGAGLDVSMQENAAGNGTHSLGFATTDRALTLSAQARSQRAADELTLQTSFELDGRVARLVELAAPFAPVQAGVSGDLHAQGELAAVLAESALTSASGRIDLFLTSLAARDAAGKSVPLEALARTTLSLAGKLDARSGLAELSSVALEASGLRLRGSGRVLGLAPGARPEVESSRIELEADLERLGRELARVLDLGGWTLAGSPLTAEVALATKEQRVDASGKLSAARVSLGRPEGTPIELAEVGLDFDLGYDAAPGSLHVRRAEARSQTATLELTGTLNELSEPAKARGAMQLELAGRLERILGDLGLETAEDGRRSSGALSAKLALEGDRGAFRVNGECALADFRLELAPAAEGQPPTVLEERAIELAGTARVSLAALDVELETLTLESGLARGGARGRLENLRALGAEPAGSAGEVRFVGLTGQLAYVPDRLGVVLAPFLPGKLAGAEEQRVTFTLDGRARDFDPMTLLAGTQARVDLGLGQFERPEIQLGGALVLEAKDEKLLVRGDLLANGGSLKLDGTLDLAPAGAASNAAPRGAAGSARATPRSKLSVNAKALKANAGLAPLLALVHPAFGATQLAQGSLEGLIGLDLDVSYDGPLTLDELKAGWKTLPKEPINGSGRLQIDGASLRGAPLLALLSEFGVDGTRALDLRPIEFTIQKGRVCYAKPWTWTLSGTETTFTGSLGLDQSLDLAWNVPITDKLVKRWSFLSALNGESLSIPLRGSVTKPRLETDELLADLASKAAKSELESRLGLGKKSGDEDPNEILKRADELWSQGQKKEAAALYSRLREDFKLSLTYALNKDRIKDRSKFAETPR